MTAVRFLLDEHVDKAVAEGLRRRGIDARTVHELGRRGLPDESHVDWAWANGWVIVTGDRDYLRIASRRQHGGIVFYRRRRATIGGLVRGLERILESETLESMRDEQRYLS